MTHENLLYLLPYAGSLGISLGILFFVRFSRNPQQPAYYFWYVLGITLYIVGNILEMILSGMTMKLFWEGFQWAVSAALLAIFPIICLQIAKVPLPHYKRPIYLSLLPQLVFIIALTVGAWNGSLFSNKVLLASEPFTRLGYDLSPLLRGYLFYACLPILIGSGLLIKRAAQFDSRSQNQIWFMLPGLLLPLIGSLYDLSGILPSRWGFITPQVISFGNLCMAWGITHFGFFKTALIERDKVFEALADPVVILDKLNNVADINTSMLALMDKTAEQVIGKPAKEVFDQFPIPIKMFTHVSYARTETSFEINHKQIHYELTIWPLYDSNKKMTGRLYISHDITALKELENELRKLNTKLEDRVQERTKELAEAYESMLEGLARALELRDKETEGHSRRVTENTLKIALKMGLKPQETEQIRSGAILHDIGKISIPDEILHKPGKLTPEERLIVQEHPETANKLLSPIPFLKKAMEIPYCHHEKWDGTGYPRGLKGDEIPLSARIFAVADVWDALSNDRPYNKAWQRERIVEYFKEETGKHFDPIIAKLFLSMVERGEI